MREAYAECRQVLARHSRSFSLAARLFPRARRDEVAAVYAWCRECDDAIDLAPPGTLDAALARLHVELDALYAGEPQASPVNRAFQEVVRTRGIPRVYPCELLAGMAMDVANPPYDTLDDLLLYCWRVAGTVGLMMCHVMGIAREDAKRQASHLGVAMQLTNICRDVLEDWGRGRLYVPSALLSAEVAQLLRARDGAPLADKAGAELASAAAELLTLADRYYASADRGIEQLEPRSALAVRTARWVYAEIGNVISRRGCDVLAGRAVVPGRTKLRLAGRALARFARERRDPSRRDRLVSPPREALHYPEAVRLR